MSRQKPLDETDPAATGEEAPPAAPREDVRVVSSPVRCPFCHEDVATADRGWVACAGCLARHHAACWRESRACASCGDRHCLAGGGGRRRTWLVVAGLLVLGVGLAIVARERVARYRERLHEEVLAVVTAEAERRAQEEAARERGRYRGETAIVTALREKAEVGDADAMLALARRLEKGDGVWTNIGEAQRWRERAAEAGNGEAMVEVAVAFGLAKDDKQALLWYERAQGKGRVVPPSWVNDVLGQRVRENETLALLKKRADAGDRDAMLDLATYLTSHVLAGVSDAQRFAEALHWRARGLAAYRESAARSVEDMLTLGRLHHQGARGVPQDADEARKWYTLAANTGDADAMYWLGELYRGKLLPNRHQAIDWLQRAAERGHTSAMGSLVAELSTSEDPKAQRGAITWLRRLRTAGFGWAADALRRALERFPSERLPGDPK